MTTLALAGHSGNPIVVDCCAACRVFWFDTFESLSLSPASTLRLFTQIGAAATGGKPALAAILRCPRCSSRLLPTHDRQRDTPFEYWRCDRRHGRLTTFFNFLREKNFIKTLSAPQLAELRLNIQIVNCSNCGAPIDLTHASVCPHCRSAISILDVAQAGMLVSQLHEASTPRPTDPALPIDLLRVRREVDAAFATLDHGQDWWRRARSSDLVAAGVAAIARWLNRDR